jgi:signal peptidase II
MEIARKARAFWPLVVLVLLTDCTTKELAVSALDPHAPRRVVGDFVRFTLAFNAGAAMSISAGEHSRVVFSVVALVAVVILARLYRLTASKALLRPAALALVVGGALGNLLDRLRSPRGVVDFIDIGLGDLRFWVFNVADVGLWLGAVLLAVCLTREPVEPGPRPGSRSR